MKWLNQSLLRRLLVSLFLIVFLGFGIIGIFIYKSTTDYLTDQQRQDMLRQARNVNGAILHSEQVTPEISRTLEQIGEFSETTIWLINKSGEIVASSSKQELFIGGLINEELLADILEGKTNIQVMDIEEDDRPMLSVIVPWGTAEQIHGGIILHSPIGGIKSTAQNIREIVLWAILFGIAIVGLLVSYFSWSITKPLKKIEEAANEIARGNYSKQVEHNVPGEIGELINSFNRMAQTLNNVEKERDALEKRRTDFIANISHELRTPLTAMKGFLEALMDGLVKDRDSQQRYYEIMYRESEYLNVLVNDLMDLIKLEKDEVSLDLYYVQLEEVLKKVALNLQPTIDEKGNQLVVDAPAQLPPILGDSMRLEQIFKNLIHNANKFTSNGMISIRFHYDDKHLYVDIGDTGVGIPDYDLKRIWERFFKVDRVRGKEGRGTGLGLAIVKELVQLHQGSISVESQIGKGTTFHLTFPLDLQL
ncbi:sensor histidine kinase [Halalkalibacter urbisdiaboli]|uniref:sensor histidine kinase n=1 Tax=Halalkalibacter urbisdiaboli TaxID=1960589 RepID=UPI000B447AF1|nr:HAMP domain-containing sensor histidine kinase [Halalkalibacter urbisdiaboli]